MVVHWMRVGFVHGVMNTDNMSILGLTIDYGPYGWLDDFDPHWTPNTTDAMGRRYRYGQQPAIAQWNLLRLADAVAPILDSVEPLQAGLDRFGAVFAAEYDAMLAAKLGLDAGDETRAGETRARRASPRRRTRHRAARPVSHRPARPRARRGRGRSA